MSELAKRAQTIAEASEGKYVVHEAYVCHVLTST